MHYSTQKPGTPVKEIWNEKTVFVLSGGFNLVNAAGFAAAGFIPKGLPLNINFATRNATAIKGGTLTEALAADGTAPKVKKGSNFVVGDIVGTAAQTATVSNIDKSNAAYDVLTLSGAIGAVSNGGTLFSGTEVGVGKILKATALVYADVKYSAVDEMKVSGVIQAYEVKNALLPYALTDTQKSELSSRFFFV